MRKIHIHPRIIKCMGLSVNEMKVFDVLISYTMAREAFKIARSAGVSVRNISTILRALERRDLVISSINTKGIKTTWRYKNGLEFMRTKRFGKDPEEI